MEENIAETKQAAKAYETPKVIYESSLEVRAGSPLGLPDPLDLTGSGQK